jgi:hypothetical protein
MHSSGCPEANEKEKKEMLSIPSISRLLILANFVLIYFHFFKMFPV